MSTSSKIEWTNATWNPVVGCKKVSPGCQHCYAERMACRLAAMADADEARGKNPGRKTHYRQVVEGGHWNGRAVTVPEALEDPLHWKRPRRVFVCSMSDLFHKDVPDEYIDRVFCTMGKTQQHTYQILTKRPERMLDYFMRVKTMPDWTPNHPANVSTWHLPNAWLGVTCENQEQADERIPLLLDTPAAVRFVSVEPMLGPVDLYGGDPDSPPHPALDWVICGGESGPGARPMHPDWARSLCDQCQAADVPFFFKQWGAWVERPTGAYSTHYTFDDGTTVFRVGKHRAGHLLNGREWNEYPKKGEL